MKLQQMIVTGCTHIEHSAHRDVRAKTQTTMPHAPSEAPLASTKQRLTVSGFLWVGECAVRIQSMRCARCARSESAMHLTKLLVTCDGVALGQWYQNRLAGWNMQRTLYWYVATVMHNHQGVARKEAKQHPSTVLHPPRAVPSQLGERARGTEESLLFPLERGFSQSPPLHAARLPAGTP